jgi:hypothetical protein
VRDFHTEIFADGFRDKIFDTEFVAALGRALADKDSNMKSSAVDIFRAAIAQGSFSSVCGLFIVLKYFQRVFETKYLILRLSPHLYVHSVMKFLTSGGVQSNYS